jgi:hypothetical protein
MTPRSRSKFVVFSHPFELKGVDRILPAGDYRVVTDEELIEELSFPFYRRISRRFSCRDKVVKRLRWRW